MGACGSTKAVGGHPTNMAPTVARRMGYAKGAEAKDKGTGKATEGKTKGNGKAKG